MPVVQDEAGTYGYTLENRHMVEAFRSRRMPDETFADGVEVVRMIMAAYRIGRARTGCRLA
jgi:predicted dehydrogenase